MNKNETPNADCLQRLVRPLVATNKNMKLTPTEKEIIELIREEHGVQWHDQPYAHPTKKGIYISLTERDDDDKYVSWKYWEECILNSVPEDVEASIAMLEKSLARIKRKFKAQVA